MNQCGCILQKIIDVAISIKKEYDIIKELKIMNLEELPVYENSTDSMNSSIERMLKLWKNEIPIQHTLKISLLENLNMKLNKFFKILSKFKIWSDGLLNEKKVSCTFSCVKKIVKDTPSSIKKELSDVFEEINPMIGTIINLEKTIFGSALRIKHPVLQMAWMMIGENQLCDTAVSKTFLIESLIALLAKEEEQVTENDIKNICNMVDKIDTMPGLKSDNLISIFELDMIEVTDENCGSVRNLIENPSYKKNLTPKSLMAFAMSLSSLPVSVPVSLPPIKVKPRAPKI
uniref:Uncharacterized protein n=1 Tax=viral metagenome TaxID=1070528 RepID=A0A6C0E2T5_9ZZZZ